MASWYKRAWNSGIPLADQYEMGDRPPSSHYRKDPQSRVHVAPEFGGNEREGYPRGIGLNDDQTEYGKVMGKLPGEGVLMDQDPPTGEGLCHDELVSEGEGFGDNDKLPPNSVSKRIDNVDVGPHNMWTRGVFRRVKDKSRVRGLNTI